MRYVIFGAGGTGGAIGSHLAKGGKDSTIIARGAHLDAMQKNGLHIRHLWDGTQETIPVTAVAEEDYAQTPDVIFVCVKGYSLDGVLPFIRRVAGPQTVVIPILNIFGTGSWLQERLPGTYVLDGCVYVSASREAPGELVQHGSILRIVFGPRRGQEDRPALAQIERDLADCDITPVYSHHVERDCLEKFSYVSPIGAAGLYCNAVSGDFQREGRERDLFVAMIREVAALAAAMGFPFEKDYAEVNLKILATLSPDATTSMQRDVYAGRPSEIDGLVYQVVRLGARYGVDVPNYTMVADEMRRRGLK